MNNAEEHNITPEAQELFDMMLTGVSEAQNFCRNCRNYFSEASARLESLCKSDNVTTHNNLTSFDYALKGYYMPYIEADTAMRREVWGIMDDEQKKAMITCLIEASKIKDNHVQDFLASEVSDYYQEAAYLAKLCEELGGNSPSEVIRSFAT